MTSSSLVRSKFFMTPRPSCQFEASKRLKVKAEFCDNLAFQERQNNSSIINLDNEAGPSGREEDIPSANHGTPLLCPSSYDANLIDEEKKAEEKDTGEIAITGFSLRCTTPTLNLNSETNSQKQIPPEP